MSKLYPQLRAVEDRDKRFEGKMLLLKPRYLEALLAMKGGAVAPDANGTLRVAYGTVRKAPAGEPGSNIGAFTSLSSMAKKVTGQEPFTRHRICWRRSRAALIRASPKSRWATCRWIS